MNLCKSILSATIQVIYFKVHDSTNYGEDQHAIASVMNTLWLIIKSFHHMFSPRKSILSWAHQGKLIEHFNIDNGLNSQVSNLRPCEAGRDLGSSYHLPERCCSKLD